MRWAFVILFAACTVPSLGSLGDKRCDLDAGLGCVSGFVCTSGLCKVPMGGACTEGQSRACGNDAGACRPGTQRCVDGQWGGCENAVGPMNESCDGQDNDCNGRIDDGLASLPCEKSQGVCMGAAKSCVDGGYVSSCGVTEYGPFYEQTESSCDGRDNDCDGTSDESVSGGACPNVGVCAGAMRVCAMGMPGACMANGFEASESSCDGRDNDCNGSIDRLADGGLIRGSTACPLSAGVCANAFTSCVDGGIESSCSAASYGPNYEVVEARCDGMDNDCDSVVDRLPDGGFLRTGACELSVGVCANNPGRACINGNGEPVCTAASYGTRYQSVEFSCDGLDNDCDGRDDWSKEAALFTSANALSSHLSLAPFPGGLGGVFVDERNASERVFFRLFDDALRPTGFEVELSDSTAARASRPNLTRLGADFAASWIEQLPDAGQRVAVGRISTNGARAWTQYATPTTTAVYKEPRLTATASDQVLVGWIESPALLLKATVFDGAGNRSAAVTTLAGGAGELVFDFDVGARPTNDFVAGWVAQQAGEFRVRFRAFNAALAGQGTPREHTFPGETADKLRVARFGAGPQMAACWVSSLGASNATIRGVSDVLNTSSTADPLATFAGSIADLALQSLPTGAITFWSQGIPQPRLIGRSFAADAGLLDVTPSGVSGLFAPTIAVRDGGSVVVGYECDRGQGLDLYGQAICF